MARTGRFGRQPRAAQSLTNTLVAIAREFQQQRDSNLMDAWQKGGMFEGRKATDELVLKHWADRMRGVSKDDPLHDTYKNAHTQLDYSIHESKMTAAFALHKATDAQMIHFYLGWSKKVPKNSEFYRVLQRDAGQYMRNTKAASDAAAKRAAEALYQRQQAGTRNSHEAASEYMIDVLRRVAQSGYADGGIAALIQPPGTQSDLTDFDINDPENMLRLLTVISGHGGKRGHGTPDGTDEVIFHNDDGKGVTGKDIFTELQHLDPRYKAGNKPDIGYITGLMDEQIKGLNERIKRANETGHITDAVRLEKSKVYVAALNRQVGSWPVQRSYNDLRETRDAVFNDPTASPAAVLKADQEYKAGLYELSQDDRVAANDNYRSRIIAELNGDSSVASLHESFTGLGNAASDLGSPKDAANSAAHVEFVQGQVDAVAKTAALADNDPAKVSWTYGSTNSQGVFVPGAGGNEIGAATYDQINAGGANMQTVTITDPRGGVPIKMVTTGIPIYATAKDPVSGLPLHPANANPVGYAYDVYEGGKTVTRYGFATKDGFVFSEDPPWDDSIRATASSTGGNHLEVDLTSVVTKMGQVDLSKDADLGNGFHVQGSKPAGPKGGDARPGELIFEPLVATTATSTRNATGGSDPNVDFHSLTLSTLMGSMDGMSILNNLDKNPEFQRQLDDDAHNYAGAQRDPKTGAWVPGTGDLNKLGAATFQINMAKTANTLVNASTGFLVGAANLWQRTTTGSAFANGGSPTQPGANGGFTPYDAGTFAANLASDVLKGTPFEALGNAFLPGTNQIKKYAGPDGDPRTAIKTVGTIKLPNVGPVNIDRLEVSAPVPTATAQQQSSVAPTGTHEQQATQSGSTAPSGSDTSSGTHSGYRAI